MSGITIVPGRLLALTAVALGLAACGPGTATPTAQPSATPTTSASPSATPTPTATAAPTPTPAVLSQVDAQALAGRMVFHDSGYWYECDLPPQSLAACPFTARLAQRIPVLSKLVAPQGVGGGPVVLRQQLFAATPQVTAVVAGAGGAYTMTIRLNIGSLSQPHNVDYDLTVVRQGDAWLVDDIACAGRPETGAYQAPTAADWTCE